MKKKFILMLVVVMLVTPFVVAAQSNSCTGGRESGDIAKCVSQIYIWSLGISGILALTMMVIGGYLVMTSRGNGQQASNGKSFILSSLAGMVLLLCAYLLLNTINNDLTDFRVPSLDSLKTQREKDKAGGTQPSQPASSNTQPSSQQSIPLNTDPTITGEIE